MAQCAHGKSPAKQIQSTLIAVAGSGHTKKQTNAFEVVILYARKYAQGAEVRLTGGS